MVLATGPIQPQQLWRRLLLLRRLLRTDQLARQTAAAAAAAAVAAPSHGHECTQPWPRFSEV
jgi:hypothetical protein